jgi:hypothetical protein
VTIEENIKKKLNNAINEELSVSNDVYNTSLNILLKINEYIKKTEYKQIKKGIKTQEFSFHETILNKKILVEVIHYNFGNNEYFEQYETEITYSDGSSISDGNRLNNIKISCYSISNKFYSDNAMDVIQHEVEHVFQGIKGSKIITNFNKLYDTATNGLQSNNLKLKILSNIVYLSHKFEIDAYINGLYGYLMQKGGIPTYEDIKKTPLYINLKVFRRQLNIISKDKEYENISSTFFGIPLKKIIKNSLNAENYLINKLGKILIKVQQDKEKQGLGHLTTTKGNKQKIQF